MHTPGPWEYQEEPYDGSGVYIIGHAGLTVAECRSFNVEADTRLIAAAPDLYEALRYIANQTMHLHGMAHVSGTALAALAKVSPQDQGQQNEGAES